MAKLKNATDAQTTSWFEGTTGQRARKIAAVLQRVRPDIVLLNEFDYDASGQAADLFQRRYLEVAQAGGGEPLRYEHRYLAPVNTGVPSGLDLDGNGEAGGSGRARGNDWKFAVTADGRPSITHYDTIEAFQAASLLDIHLETGRTHQIRVHFSAVRHPCAGDLTYGADPTLAKRLGLERQWLHARQLGFHHPADGRWIEIVSEYPADLSHALDVLRDA